MLKPEKRPFLISSYNFISKGFRSPGNLSSDKLIAKARKNTGLTYLGDDFNAEALKMLVDAINGEARLNPFGRLMIREKLVGQLESRLWAEYWFKKFPEILNQEVLPIVLITGLQRTGTTKMQRFLSSLPGARALLSWEALYPAPVKLPGETRKRIARTKRNEKAVKWISPTFHSIHPIYHNRPEEDVLLLDLHFMSSSSEAIMHVPSYADWLRRRHQKEAYEYEKKLLKLLQWQKKGDFWVLKSPHHLEYLDAFTGEFPDTKIIWMHRRISDCIPSFLSMLYYSRHMFSDEVSKKAIKEHWLQKISSMLKAGIHFRSRHSESVIDVSFLEFLKRDSEVIVEIANLLPFNIDIPDFSFKKLSQEKYVSRHIYQLQDWDLNAAELKNRFSEYEEVINYHLLNQGAFHKKSFL